MAFESKFLVIIQIKSSQGRWEEQSEEAVNLEALPL